MTAAEWNPADAAAAGAHVLDMTRPGWRDQVDADRLDMSIGSDYGPGSSACVCAQLDRRRLLENGLPWAVAEGNWRVFLDQVLADYQVPPFADFRHRWRWCVMHGFGIPATVGPNIAETHRQYQRLTAAWLEVLGT